jgi:hypothetical protein
MQKQPPFDLYAGLFSVAEVAEISRVPRPIMDVWVNRNVLTPTRRQRPATGDPQQNSKKPRPARRPGRPLFACRDVFKASLIRVLADYGLSSTGSSELAGVTIAAKIPAGVAFARNAAPWASFEIAEATGGGEWMWACARSIERQRPLFIYVYAAQQNRKWSIDMHVGARGAKPCFGWNRPHIFIPMSELFADVYLRCKEILEVERRQGQVS